MAGLARRALFARLERLRFGRLEIVEGVDRRVFGSAAARPPSVTLEVIDPAFYREVALAGSIGAAESFVDRHWRVDDLPGLIRLFCRNAESLGGLDGGSARLGRIVARWAHLLRTNSRRGSRRNISAHYDLGNEFFELFLDPTMMYSSAVFPSAESTLEQAQVEKVDRLCRKLDLQADDRVLEIGSGWGYFAEHAVRNYGCRVVTTTISRRQYERVCDRISAAGLEGRAEVLHLDYRDLPRAGLGRFDKLVSIEMIEAVGHRYLPRFFATVSEMLGPRGVAAIQAIVIPDQRYESYRRSVDFIQKHIFPGGLVPSVGRMTECVGRVTDMRLMHLEEITEHYVRTLQSWTRNLLRESSALEALGLDERFQRLWEFYFGYCEGGFSERAIGCVQMLLAKPSSGPARGQSGLPPARECT